MDDDAKAQKSQTVKEIKGLNVFSTAKIKACHDENVVQAVYEVGLERKVLEEWKGDNVEKYRDDP